MASFWQAQREYDTKKRAEEYADFNSEVYGLYEFQTYSKPVNARGQVKPFLCVYRGKSGKEVSHYYYMTSNNRQERINEYKRIADSRQAEKEAKKLAQKNLVNPFKVDDIFYTSWGYDQTNVDFYKVVEVLPKSVKIVEIGSKRANDETWSVVPDVDNVIGEVTLHRVKPGQRYIHIDSVRTGFAYTGGAIYETSPYEGH